jgi:hypothetical protein
LPTQTTGDVWSRTIHESSMENMCCVDRVFPWRVYIDSIVATLGYEYHLFVAVIT